MSDDLYSEFIMDHNESPYHRGHLDQPTIAHADENPLCGDQIQLELLIDEHNRVTEARFDGHGCAISQAAASILVEEIEGKTIDELREFQAGKMLELLRARVTASRQKCALLCFKILKTMVYTLDEQRGGKVPASPA